MLKDPDSSERDIPIDWHTLEHSEFELGLGWARRGALVVIAFKPEGLVKIAFGIMLLREILW